MVRSVETILQTLMSHAGGPLPYLIVFVLLLLCGFGMPMPEDIVLFAAGMISYYGSASVWVMVAVCFAGVMIGDCSVYLIGRFYGRRLRRTALVRRILPPARMKLVRRKLHEQGNKVIFAARFMPGLRTPVFFSAGSLRLPFRVFALYDLFAALVSVPVIVYATYFFGAHVDQVISVVKRVQFGVVAVILAVVAILVLKARWNRAREEKI